MLFTFLSLGQNACIISLKEEGLILAQVQRVQSMVSWPPGRNVVVEKLGKKAACLMTTRKQREHGI